MHPGEQVRGLLVRLPPSHPGRPGDARGGPHRLRDLRRGVHCRTGGRRGLVIPFEWWPAGTMDMAVVRYKELYGRPAVISRGLELS
jgi:hypothetical protein